MADIYLNQLHLLINCVSVNFAQMKIIENRCGSIYIVKNMCGSVTVGWLFATVWHSCKTVLFICKTEKKKSSIVYSGMGLLLVSSIYKRCGYLVLLFYLYVFFYFVTCFFLFLLRFVSKTCSLALSVSRVYYLFFCYFVLFRPQWDSVCIL